MRKWEHFSFPSLIICIASASKPQERVAGRILLWAKIRPGNNVFFYLMVVHIKENTVVQRVEV